MAYPKNGASLSSSPNLPEVEKNVLTFWDSDDTFRESIR